MARAILFLRRRVMLDRRRIRMPPPALLACLYALLIACGTALLMLPISTRQPIGWGDALFTATSAVTVTGLVVVDTGSQFTVFGQAVVMVLIQLGGLGLMTFAVLILYLLGMRIGIQQRVFLRDDLNQTSVQGLVKLVRAILRFVVAVEAIGVAALAVRFVPEFGWVEGLWQSLFHTVSAFNNAGFALFPDSLSRWATDPVLNLAVPALFVLGGLGFSVVADVAAQRRWHRFSLHTKLMLVGTAVLIVWSVTAFAVLEWNNPQTLGLHDGTLARLTISWFQGLTTRTAGFNTIEIGAIHDSTALMFMTLMVIGGGSTSTAGGIKVTTFIVLLLATIAFFKRRASVPVFGRSLGLEEILKVLALTMISLLVIMTGIFLIALSHDGAFLDLAFEVASAFGTVGLSRGATGELDVLGRSVIIAIMFVGRIGPLTLGFFLATRLAPRIRYPAGRVYLG